MSFFFFSFFSVGGTWWTVCEWVGTLCAAAEGKKFPDETEKEGTCAPTRPFLTLVERQTARTFSPQRKRQRSAKVGIYACTLPHVQRRREIRGEIKRKTMALHIADKHPQPVTLPRVAPFPSFLLSSTAAASPFALRLHLPPGVLLNTPDT